jgi:hypothetical protein
VRFQSAAQFIVKWNLSVLYSKVNKELYWVAPLLHSGFFKWMNNQEGTAGYVMVSATNERDVKLVQTSDGKPIKIKYQPEAYFQSNIERHLY